MKVVDLKSTLRQLNLSVTGKKSELKERLKEYCTNYWANQVRCDTPHPLFSDLFPPYIKFLAPSVFSRRPAAVDRGGENRLGVIGDPFLFGGEGD